MHSCHAIRCGVVVLVGGLTMAACTPPPPTPWIAAGCLDSSVTGQADVLYSGTENQLNNVSVYGTPPLSPSTNGSCSGDFILFSTVVRAADQAVAHDLCVSIGAPPAPFTEPTKLQALGYNVPADAWGC